MNPPVATSWRLTPQLVVLIGVALVAWLATLVRVRDMGAMSGTMGVGPLAFLAIWTPMMAAMMLPSVAPTASLYTRTMQSGRPLRLMIFVLGYLGVWALAGVPAYGAAWLLGWLGEHHQTAGKFVAAGVFASAGLYQLTALKYRCLRHCRSPLSLLLHYSSYGGKLKEFRVGFHHGAYCLGCCWALMALLVVLGAMNIAAMLMLTAAIGVEKLWSRGEAFARLVGVAALVLAVVVLFKPELAGGLGDAGEMTDAGEMMS